MLAAGRKFDVLATNQLGRTFKASPAVADGALFLRNGTTSFASRPSAKPSPSRIPQKTPTGFPVGS